MMLFIISGSLGIILTILIVYRIVKRKNFSHHHHALAVSVGMGLTWMVAPLTSFLAPNSGYPEKGFVIFWISHSVVVGVVLYIADRVYLKKKGQQ
jgi:uncharacterized membrane protein